jgi:hypothetical protein
LIVGLAIYWFATKFYLKGKGVDVELAFREVPPL